jgi:hypothetical protein
MSHASEEDYYAFPYDLNLDDQLFKYGVRINPDLIQDGVSGKYPIVVGGDRQSSTDYAIGLAILSVGESIC